eukprot:g33204.t1
MQVQLWTTYALSLACHSIETSASNAGCRNEDKPVQIIVIDEKDKRGIEIKKRKIHFGGSYTGLPRVDFLDLRAKAGENSRLNPLHRCNNPHLDQNFPGCLDLSFSGGNAHTLTQAPFTRILLPEAPSLPWVRRQGQKKTLLHWGQRKLLICEIEFLTKFASPEFEWKVLYAGAAPGEHLLLLSELFPNCHFILVDPRPIFVLPSKSFTILKTYLNVDSLAKNALLSNLKTSSDRLLFISDIRSIDIRTTPDEQVENSVKEDMKLQMELHLALRPSKSILKFRLPYGQGRSKYLDGEVLLPVWGPQTTTESRLIPHGVTTKIWDHELYQNQMFYFNVTQRGRYYPHGVSFDDGGGLDHCYDCTAEIYILTEYLKQRSNTTFTVSTLSKTISSSLSCISNNDRTLADCQPPKPLVSSLRSSQSRDKDLKKQRLMNKKTLISNIAITTFIQQKRKTKPTIKQPFGLCPVDRPGNVKCRYFFLSHKSLIFLFLTFPWTRKVD